VSKNPVAGERNITLITLFTSTGTLVCCAMPIIFVTLGLGSVVVSMTSAFPFLITLAKHKVWVFAASALMLAISGWLMYRPGRHCPSDPVLARKCATVQKWNQRIYWTSVVIWCVGFFAAFLALPLRKFLEG